MGRCFDETDQLREAVAAGEIPFATRHCRADRTGQNRKGKTSRPRAWPESWRETHGDLIPLCHPLPITHAKFNSNFPPPKTEIMITASAK